MFDSSTIVFYGFFIIFFSGVVHGLSGFGFALVAVPMLVLFIAPKTAIPIVLLFTVLVNIPVLLEARKWLDIKRFLPLIISAIVGMPLGTYLLIALPVNMLKLIIGFAVVPFSIALMFGFKKKIQNEKIATIPIGFVSGFLKAAISIGSPPIVLFFSNQGMQKQAFRANLVLYFLVLNIAALISYIVTGLISREVVQYTVFFLPAMLLGVLVGMALTKKINELFFRRIVLSIVTLSGILAIYSGMRALIT